MTRVEIENQLLQEMRTISVEKLEEILNFALFLKHRLNLKQTPIKQQGKAKCLMHEDFKITNEQSAWPTDFFDKFVGCLPDFPAIESEGDYEKREVLW
ncbi:hypothetical protein [Candidatus Parabeggiatoa sp. HSG14]|uniref:hypothetical protein n=1 Tax=Candidatus Parabeggiatoa sp. HSG14 TaxID=3055593 RepID=UPI0025A714CC|nr:hypothetical protein [Thiotrichales bacterium HSG14]